MIKLDGVGLKMTTSAENPLLYQHLIRALVHFGQRNTVRHVQFLYTTRPASRKTDLFSRFDTVICKTR